MFIRKQKLSCGCGGVLGHSKVSWNLVIRNLILKSQVMLPILVDPKLLKEIKPFQIIYDFNLFLLAIIISLMILTAPSLISSISLKTKSHS